MWTNRGLVRLRWWARTDRAPVEPDPADMGAEYGMELSLAALESAVVPPTDPEPAALGVRPQQR